jgi:hypothetical protein
MSEFRWLTESVKDALLHVPDVRIVSGLEIEFDRWYWGSVPALVRRGELVIARDMREASLFGRTRSLGPKRSLDSVADEADGLLHEDGKSRFPYFPAQVYTFTDGLVVQRHLGYLPFMDRYFGAGLRPLVEHVEVRQTPSLLAEFAARVASHNPVGGKMLFRMPGVYPPELIYNCGQLLTFAELRNYQFEELHKPQEETTAAPAH